MKSLKPLLILAFPAVMAGCGINPEKLNAPAVASRIYVDADRETKETIPDFVTTYTLRKGIYESAKEDAKGIYYLGPEGCFISQFEMNNGTIRGTTNCGIFIPHNANQPVAIFTVAGTVKTEKFGKLAEPQVKLVGNIGTSPIAIAATNAAIKMESGQYVLRAQKDDPLVKDLRSLVKPK